MSEQVARSQSEATTSTSVFTSSPTREVNTAADLAILRSKGKTLTSQELTELNTRITALEKMARMEDRLRSLEKRKRTEAINDSISQASPFGSSDQQLQPEYSLNQASLIRSSIEQDFSSDSSDLVTYHRNKRPCYTQGIKVTPSYTLKVSSSLREWGDWKLDIERVFEGDPDTYRSGAQKILKALDYLDANL